MEKALARYREASRACKQLSAIKPSDLVFKVAPDAHKKGDKEFVLSGVGKLSTPATQCLVRAFMVHLPNIYETAQMMAARERDSAGQEVLDIADGA